MSNFFQLLFSFLLFDTHTYIQPVGPEGVVPPRTGNSKIVSKTTGLVIVRGRTKFEAENFSRLSLFCFRKFAMLILRLKLGRLYRR